MARTYLERSADQFADASREELVAHGLRALKESLSQDKELTVENTSVGIVGVGSKPGLIENFKLYDGQEVKEWIEAVAADPETAAADDAPAPESMDVDNN